MGYSPESQEELDTAEANKKLVDFQKFKSNCDVASSFKESMENSLLYTCMNLYFTLHQMYDLGNIS